MGKYSDSDWAEAKERCGLNDEDVRMARELGMTPRSLIKNIPSRKQRWKAPVKEWVRSLYEKKHGPRELKIVPPAPAESEDSFAIENPYGEPGDPEGIEDEEPFEESYEEYRRKEREPPAARETADQDALMLRRQQNFRAAAEYVAREFALLPEVVRVSVFGSVAEPLRKEIPRFHKFRRNRVPVWHECNDVDLAVWMTDLTGLKALQRARGRVLNRLEVERGIGVPHFEVDVHIFEPGTDRYRGRLCIYGECPKPGKKDCFVDGCGAQLFLRQFDDYKFDRLEFWETKKEVLFERPGAPPEDESASEITDRDLPF